MFILQKKTLDETTKKLKYKQSSKIRANKDEPIEKEEETQSKKERKHGKSQRLKKKGSTDAQELGSHTQGRWEG